MEIDELVRKLEALRKKWDEKRFPQSGEYGKGKEDGYEMAGFELTEILEAWND